jgi:endonuclease I
MRFTAVILLTLSAATRAAEPPAYYATTNGLTGTALRAELHRIIRTTHTALTYSQTRAALEECDQDPAAAANVILIYTRRSEPKTNFVRSPPQNNNEWNREHLWPDSRGILGDGADNADLFNLRPADVTVNAERGNLAFEETSVVAGGQPQRSAEAPLTSFDANSWEPPPEMKGDIARSMFYMALRYEGNASQELDLRLTDNLSLVTGNQPYMGRLTTLLLWHLADPVSPAEMLRNDCVQAKQGNRNPFIDRPEWVKTVYGDPMFMESSISGESLTLRWWSGLENAVLETGTTLTGVWSPVGGTPAVNGTTASLITSATPGRRFFRVRFRGVEAP